MAEPSRAVVSPEAVAALHQAFQALLGLLHVGRYIVEDMLRVVLQVLVPKVQHALGDA